MYALDVGDLMSLELSRLKVSCMRPISSGVASGSSLAVALKLLGWLDNHQDPIAACTNLGLQFQRGFDWATFTLGLVCGILLYAFLELLITIRCAIVAWAGSGHSGPTHHKKPLYKLL